ncbi:hypothetical protein BS50DRAFT_12804 [Corynespora cassiicola Philippines]|uniref:Uncharacterized protein n=1 Tax=Corynespora cassiicola Philippines TaxID=1448308 RepID=A0A2T2P9F6_CORCC|nr:hypothetical protein BS50DRAFT_12804 [Corynespora cassiicola Philippines]
MACRRALSGTQSQSEAMRERRATCDDAIAMGSAAICRAFFQRFTRETPPLRRGASRAKEGQTWISGSSTQSNRLQGAWRLDGGAASASSSSRCSCVDMRWKEDNLGTAATPLGTLRSSKMRERRARDFMAKGGRPWYLRRSGRLDAGTPAASDSASPGAWPRCCGGAHGATRRHGDTTRHGDDGEKQAGADAAGCRLLADWRAGGMAGWRRAACSL